ncbi:MAG: acyl carrier protein [Planctomycetales bacterium]
MNPEEIRQILADILSRIVPDEDLSALNDDVPFREQIELDSMDFLDIVMELRKQYRIQIPEEEYGHLNTMRGAVGYLTPLMKSVQATA